MENLLRLMPNRKLWVALLVAFLTNVATETLAAEQAAMITPMLDNIVSLFVGLVAGYFTPNAPTDSLTVG